MKKILVLVAMLGLDADPTMAAALFDERAKKFTAGYEFLKQQKYQEARTAFEAGLQQSPANAMAHFYLGDACRGLKAWACAEEHYETSLELDAQSPVAGLAKQRGRKAKVWRLLDEGKQAINEPNAPPTKDRPGQGHPGHCEQAGSRRRTTGPSTNSCKRKLSRGTKRVTRRRRRLSFRPVDGLVPAGEFMMGSWREIQTNNRCTESIWVPFSWINTNCQWGNMRSSWKPRPTQPAGMEYHERAMHQSRPVANVDWADATPTANGPVSACRPRRSGRRRHGGQMAESIPGGMNLRHAFTRTQERDLEQPLALAPVGTFEEGKSPYGIYDMAGNVWEWVSDWYDPEYYQTSPPQNPSGPRRGSHKVVRGGSWGSGTGRLRSADREIHLPSFQGFGTGFRCAKTP